MRVAHPGIHQFFIEFNCLVLRLVARLVVLVSVEFISPIGRRDHVDNSLVPAIPQLNVVPPSLIEQRLPHVVIRVRRPIHHAPIAYDHRLLVRIDGNFDENILEGHLCTHDVDLEPDRVLQLQLVGLDHGSALHQHRGRLRDLQHLESELRQHLVQGGQRGRLASAWAACEADSNYWVLALFHCFWVVQRLVPHPVRIRGALGDVAGGPLEFDRLLYI